MEKRRPPLPLNVNGVCAANPLINETLTAGPKGGIKNVVVSLVSTDATKVHPDVKAAAMREAYIDNRKCRFEPRVLVVAVNQPLVIKNSDEFGHNTKVPPFDNDPFNPIIPAGSQFEHRFAAAETTPTPIECNIHPWMKGYLVIRNDLYAGISDENGVVVIEDLPSISKKKQDTNIRLRWQCPCPLGRRLRLDGDPSRNGASNR